ncbi:MAG: DUF892 family protein [Bacteroidota bacterium]|nr:DUF892 family protein [Bacteroidota bacterium]
MTNTNNHSNQAINEEDNSFKNLFLAELSKAFSMETMHVKILTELVQASSGKELREMLDDHLDITEVHINRIEEIYRLLDTTPKSETNKPMDELCQEVQGIIEENKEPAIKDANMLTLVQKMEHLEISTYKSLRTYSDNIQNKDISELIQATLDEEEHIEKIFSQIAEKSLVNI